MAEWVIWTFKILFAIFTNSATIYKIVEMIYQIVHASTDKKAVKAEIVADIEKLCKEKGVCVLPNAAP